MRATLLRATLVTLGTTTVLTAEAPPPHDRAEATKIIADMRRIVTSEGVERLEKVRIGGIDQWVSIRGVDRRNPILLYIHGGPGYVEMPTSWYFQRGWEEYFTVVQWDQRGAGKTYLANDPKVVAPTMTLERMNADTDEMIQWLRKEFGKQKIFVLGHSWGSYLGLMAAQRHPEWLHAYIGMGQATNIPESERRGWRFAMDRARAAGNEAAVHELESIAPYGAGNKSIPLEHILIQRKWVGFYGGVIGGRTDNRAISAATSLSPEYTDAEIARLWDGNGYSEEFFLSRLLTMDLSSVTELKCPMILFNGRDDYNVSASVAAEWFERLKAPSKKLVWFEHVAHEPQNEAPGRTLVALVQYALPIAERAGDVAPHQNSASDR
ncbi:alpha/beta hydrolase [Opitutaceae bacterium EW11]|nr:alpha/beta hydrolase [Opitutaceae bacterium EW11]